MKKSRADQLVFERGLAESREKAKRLIMAGEVLVRVQDREEVVQKPGQPLPQGCELHLRQRERFVSRGGYKLLTGLEHFQISPAGKVCLDGGASTGGFTDCLLQEGAVRVYAVDVGKAQLHEKLRSDPRVVSMEKINLRHAPSDLLPEKADLLTIDLSFISLTLVLPACIPFLKTGADILALVKPQFELGPDSVGRGGVVRSRELQERAVEKVARFAREELHLSYSGCVPSRIKGPKGNQEYLVHFKTPSKLPP